MLNSPLLIPFLLKDIVKGKTVCDIGCAEGKLMGEFRKYAGKVIGIEWNEKSWEITDEKGLEVIKGDFTEIELPDADVYYYYVNDFDTEGIENFELVHNLLKKQNKKGLLVWGFQESVRGLEDWSDVINIPIENGIPDNPKDEEFKIKLFKL